MKAQSNCAVGCTVLVWLAGIWLAATDTAPAWARDIYVNNESGDDRNDGLAQTNVAPGRGPFRTIRRALAAARAGDHIHVAATGTPYHESITLQAGRHSGVASRPFVLEGNGAILDGSQPVPPDAWEGVGPSLFRFRSETKSTHVLFLDGIPATRRRVPPGSGAPPELQPLEWCLFDGHVYFRTEPGKLPWAYNLSHTVLPVGITLYEVRHAIVRDFVVQGFALDGVNAHDGVTSVSLVGLTCRGNGRSGVSVGGASRVVIEACLLGDNAEAQLRTEGFSHTRLVNCDLIDHPAAPAIDRQGGEVIQEMRTVRAVSAEAAPR
ncbi:MAG: hypothetical protein KatS3mg110_0631 [Pirellulaceae bacterium]|nr:MAG: hypothetical protein KatS3mg110_0631 [Pirellulaceae bacterium]